jgi:two-component system, cell cycle response regulator DivK
MARARILLAEDNENNLKLFRDVLQVNGFETLEATTGEDAIELATRNDPILILMDIRLAGLDGVAALHRLREDERTASIPVVALTAQAMAGDRERFLETGFDDYISKPVNVREFLAVVRRHGKGQGDG